MKGCQIPAYYSIVLSTDAFTCSVDRAMIIKSLFWFMSLRQTAQDVKEGRVAVSGRTASQLKMLASQRKHADVCIFRCTSLPRAVSLSGRFSPVQSIEASASDRSSVTRQRRVFLSFLHLPETISLKPSDLTSLNDRCANCSLLSVFA